MASVKEHYDTHLAPLYTWMSGGTAPARQRCTELLRSLDLHPGHAGATALDLGAGNGFQSIPLAEAGYTVTAVDVSDVLLGELARDAGALPVHPVAGDLRDLQHYCPVPAPEVIVCMGDTLTHLSALTDIEHLLQDAADALVPGGHLLLTFRDYTSERTGADRFIPVRSDADRIFTCFLEFGPTHVAVHDIVHTRAGPGWHTAISVYEKIRLAPDWVHGQLVAAGLVIVRNTVQNGLVTLAARRPVHA
jgi:2-polyprenyl-3-methyl-5-hydroxy-6-metoxy-1,4-benzoquinol methylase